MIGSLLTRYATKAMLTTAANAALRGTLDVAKKAIPHVTDLVLYWSNRK